MKTLEDYILEGEQKNNSELKKLGNLIDYLDEQQIDDASMLIASGYDSGEVIEKLAKGQKEVIQRDKTLLKDAYMADMIGRDIARKDAIMEKTGSPAAALMTLAIQKAITEEMKPGRETINYLTRLVPIQKTAQADPHRFVTAVRTGAYNAKLQRWADKQDQRRMGEMGLMPDPKAAPSAPAAQAAAIPKKTTPPRIFSVGKGWQLAREAPGKMHIGEVQRKVGPTAATPIAPAAKPFAWEKPSTATERLAQKKTMAPKEWQKGMDIWWGARQKRMAAAAPLAAKPAATPAAGTIGTIPKGGPAERAMRAARGGGIEPSSLLAGAARAGSMSPTALKTPALQKALTEAKARYGPKSPWESMGLTKQQAFPAATPPGMPAPTVKAGPTGKFTPEVIAKMRNIAMRKEIKQTRY